MKYPFHTESKPVVGQEAKKLLTAIETNDAVTTPAAEITIKRILARRALKPPHESKNFKV